MLAHLERQKFGNFLRARLTVSSATEMLLDPLVIVLTLLAVLGFFDEHIGSHYVLLALLVFSLTFPGNFSLTEGPRRIARTAVINWSLIAGLLLAFAYASGFERFFPNDVMFSWIVLTYASLLTARLGVRALLPMLLARSSRSKAIIIGGNQLGCTLAQQLDIHRYQGIDFLGYFDDRSPARLKTENTTEPSPLRGKLGEVSEFVKREHVDMVYIALPMASQPRILKLLDEMKDTTVSIYFVPDIFLTDLIQGRMDSVNGMPVVSVCETPFTGLNGLLKRGSDVILSIIILCLIWPLLIFCAVAVKLSSPGPAIFKQRRYGLDGKEILVYKFRSMTSTDNGDVVRQATRNDARVTRFGAFARRTSLDELPQFINVLQGRMSIVGPRPHAVAHNELYRTQIKGYMVRHKVRPGITGWAQVNGCRGETDTVNKMERRIEFDLEYLRNWSLSLDLWIITKTILTLVSGDRKAY
jgi:putative colanic acid biosynthesis UDP-glucose lipid carrier transferase